jgi:hypothetical protein
MVGVERTNRLVPLEVRVELGVRKLLFSEDNW